eukprot:TRINITY_DN815_c0_g1_i1.p1 TRINITY_DN815_c0_g1~~TRINITY_DN815_c0_g1_i1.p1  ORF type:complete len:399 (-),score=213.57 TRINITY_DN815_c0_g1_i1:70-1266(-)
MNYIYSFFESNKEPEIPQMSQEEINRIFTIEGISEEELRSNHTLNRILGCIYGNALGDAVGLQTEFLSKESSIARFPRVTEPVEFPTRHTRGWDRGDWTDDTDQMILLMMMFTECGTVDELNFASKLRNWARKGFPELGDYCGAGMGGLTSSVLFNEYFLSEPFKASEAVWIRSGKQIAPNGGVMRTSITGCFKYDDLETVKTNTERMCKVTHFDDRCIASCIAVCVSIALILQGRLTIPTESPTTLPCVDIKQLLEAAKQHSLTYVSDQHREEFLYHLNATTLDELKLDESAKIGYTLKCMGSGFWGFVQTNGDPNTANVKMIISDLIREGGDADTNGAVCGACVGAIVGYLGLPRDWISAMPNKKWLDEKVIAFLKVANLYPQTATTTTTPTPSLA